MTGGAAAASLHVPLDELTAAGLGSTITFYAARAGAFVDLAADIRYAYGQVVIDGHHQPDHPGTVDFAWVIGLVSSR